MKNLFLNLKLDLFLELKVNCQCGFWISHQKSTGTNFHEDWPYRTQVMTMSLDTKNSKWQISEKKALKLPKFQKLISQEPFRAR